MVEIIIVEDEREAAQLYAKCACNLIISKPNCVLGLATGSSPLAAYSALANSVHGEGLNVSEVRGFALDEYVGLAHNHPQSYKSTITRTVVGPIGLDPSLVHVPDGSREGLQDAGERYDLAIKDAGGVDLQILGVGTDGHIGFNEPGSSFASGTRIKTLTEQTRLDNARFFGDSIKNVPIHCITEGIGVILRAKHIILLAFGEGKADAVAKAVEGPVSTWCPASALQLHPHVTVIVDEKAASRLKNKTYYKSAYVNKPSWQSI